MHSQVFACVSLCASICQCIQLFFLMEIFPEERSPEFKFRFYSDDALCLVKPLRGEEGEEGEEEP